MEAFQQQRTVAIKTCSACESGLLESDKFCRWCGARQEIRAAGLAMEPRYDTSRLDSRSVACRRLSGPLVNAVMSTAFADVASDGHGRALKRAILALAAVPIWLIIVLLSPLDAYALVRNLERQV